MSTGEADRAQDQGTVLLEQDGAVAELTLARPSAHNAMTWTMYEQLAEHLDQLAADEEIRAIVLKGAGGRAFAAGTDIGQFENFSGADGVAYEQRVDAIMDRLAGMPKPLIVAIQGYAVGGGLVMAAACDLRYATPTARLGIPVARTLGNCLSLKNYRRVGQALGVMRAKELLFTGRLMHADEALQTGFLTAVLPEEELLPKVREVAATLANNAPLTLWATKEAYRRLERVEEERLGAEAFADVIEWVYGSDDFREGVHAHMEKRRPVWHGH